MRATKSYVCVNQKKTLIFSVARTAEEALFGAYSLAENHGSIITESNDKNYIITSSEMTEWKDFSSRSLKDDKISLEILPASNELVIQIMTERNIIDWMEHEGRAITRNEACVINVWNKDTSKFYVVEPGNSGFGYDPDTAIQMAKYLGKYNEPPFISKDTSEYSSQYNQDTAMQMAKKNFGLYLRRCISNPHAPDKFFPDKIFRFKLIEPPISIGSLGYTVQQLKLIQKNGENLLVPILDFNSPLLPLMLNDVDMWQLEIIMDEDAVFYYVDNVPKCWEAMCGRAWVVLANKDDYYSLLIGMN
jgi:hypothetical protein